MSDLLKEAIADAKAVRETALQNAKMALEEAFTPHLKSMLSAKLAEEDDEMDDEDPRREDDDDEEDAEDMARQYREDDDEMENEEMDDDNPVDINIDADGDDDDEEEVDEGEIIEIDGVKYAPIVSEEDEEDDPRREDDDEMETEELDLESVIKELETEIAESEESDEDSVNEGEDEDDKVDEEIVTEEDDEDDKEKQDEQSTSSGIGKGTAVKAASSSDEEDPGKGKVHESVEAMQTELNEYKEAVSFLREKLHEVNILNAKLLFTNRLFKEYVLSNDQKMKVVETFDRAQTTREIKLVYSTLAESFNDRETVKKNSIKESASRKTGTTAPKKKIISEEDNVANRFKKLAGILKD